jgi:serine/threonine-protein kinase
MDATRWKEISALAAEVAESAPAEREALLASRPDLREEVQSFLAHDGEGSGPLDVSPMWPPPRVSMVGRDIGPYRVIREVAQGGMGIVLLARRTNVDFDQVVAIKLARMAFQSEFYARRFLEERQILARLEHPNIARLQDGGITADGTPYFVMQYIEGEPLDEWCAKRNLGTRERIELFITVCEAVEYAHEHLIIHRDLKPANILVNAAGEPILVDFGTARLVEAGESRGTAPPTAVPMVTLRYASPEQVAGLSGSTRTDVYALSVILYELLTGRWPYPDDSTSALDRIRTIGEIDAIPPSRSGAAGAASLAGDLDAILLKGLEKQADRRYGTAGQLADDLRHFLSHETVAARQPTWPYRAAKFLRRHRAATAAAAIAAAALAVATAISVRQARIAERERERAQAVVQFVERLLGASRPGEVTPLASRGRELRVVEIIDEAAQRVSREFGERPDVEAGLRSTIGSTYMALGSFEQARPHVDRAIELTTRVFGDAHPSAGRALTARGRLRLAAGDYAGAKADLDKALAIEVRESLPNQSFLHSLLGEATLRLGDAKTSRRHLEASLAAMRQQFGTNHVATATLINNVGVVAEEEGDQAAAERYFREAAAILRALPGPPPNLLHPLIGVQRAHFYRGEFAQAKAVCEEAYRVARAQGGDENRNTVTAMNVLAIVKAHLGEPDAEDLARRAVDGARALYPAGHFEISRSLTALGRVLIQREQAEEAERHLREALAIARRAFSGNNWRPAESQMFLGLALSAQGRADEARAAWAAGLREMEAALPPSHPRVQEARRLSR